MRGLLLRDSLLYSASRILSGIVGFFSIPIFISYFGVITYGKYSLFLALANAISSLFLGWIWQSYTRYSRQGYSQRQFFILNGISTIAASIGFTLLGTIWTSSISGVRIELVFLVFIAFVMYSSTRVYLQAARALKSYTSLELIRSLGIAITPLAIAWYSGQQGIEVLLASFFLVGLTAPLFLWRNLQNNESTSKNDGLGLLKLAQYGIPLSIWLFIASMQMYLDRYLFSRYFGEIAAGTFAGIADITIKIGAIIVIPVASSIIPLFATHSGISSLVSDRRYFLAIYVLCILYATIATLTIPYWTIYLPLNIENLFINKFSYFFFFLGGAIWQCSILFHKHLEICGRTSLLLRNILISTIFHYLLFLFLLNWYGEDAMAIAYFISSIIYSFMCWADVRTMNRPTQSIKAE